MTATVRMPSAARFATRDRRWPFWATLWAAAVAAECGALVPVLFQGHPVQGLDLLFRFTGGSFVACGLVAWRRRPDSRAGILMTATGFALFIVPVGSQLGTAGTQTFVYLFSDLWTITFVALLLTFATGGRMRSRTDAGLIAAFVFPLLILQVVYLLIWEQDDNLLAAFPDAGIEDAVDKAQRGLLALASLATAIVIGRRWRAASPTRRRALLPGVAGVVCLLLFTGMLVNDLISGSRPTWLLWVVPGSVRLGPPRLPAGRPGPRRLPGGAAALAPGARRADRPVPRHGRRARGGPAGRPGPGRGRSVAAPGPAAAGIPGLRRSRRASGDGAARCARPCVGAGGHRRRAGRGAGLRRGGRRGSGAGRGRLRRGGHRAGARSAARRGRAAPGRAAGLARADRRRGRRGAPA